MVFRLRFGRYCARLTSFRSLSSSLFLLLPLSVFLWILVYPGPNKLVAQDSASNAARTSPDQGASISDLAAAAKLARQQRAEQSARKTERSQAVDEMAQELAKSGDEPIEGAPTGFRYYYFQPGDYAILVPADAKPAERDQYGLHLLSEEAFTFRIEVILGDPVPAEGGTPEQILHNANNEYLGGCALSITGVGPAVNGHPAHSMAYQGCSINQYLLGSSELVIGDGYVMPVLCGYPMTHEDRTPNPHPDIKKLLAKYDRERLGFSVCNQILPTLKFHPYGDRWKPKQLTPPVTKPVLNKVAASTETPAVGEGPSLGAFARTNKKAPQKAVLTELKNSSAGYETFGFRYFCNKERDVCYSANVQLPTSAKRNENYNTAYTGLFQFEVPIGSSSAFIQADTGAPSDPGFLTRDQLINTKIDWWLSYAPAYHYSGVKTPAVLNEELTEIAGIPARLATSRTETSAEPVITYMAAYMVPGKFVHLRCSVPEKASGDAQGMCEHVVRSLQFPKQLDGQDPPSGEDPPGNDEQ